MTFYDDFEDFALRLAAEVREHGKDRVTQCDEWALMAFGFASPAGKFLVRLDVAKAYSEQFSDGPIGLMADSVVVGRRVPDHVIVKAVRRRLTRAWDGDRQEVN